MAASTDSPGEPKGRRRRFADEYLVDLNGTRAYKAAGYAVKNDHVASVEASKLLRNPGIAAYVRERQKTLADKVGLTQERVLRELAIVGFSSVGNYKIDDFGHVLLEDDVEPDALRAVSSIKRKLLVDEAGNKTGVETEIKLWDKTSALRMAGQHLGLLRDTESDTVANVLAALVARSMQGGR